MSQKRNSRQLQRNTSSSSAAAAAAAAAANGGGSFKSAAAAAGATDDDPEADVNDCSQGLLQRRRQTTGEDSAGTGGTGSGGGKLEASATIVLDATHPPLQSKRMSAAVSTSVGAGRGKVTSQNLWKLKYQDFLPSGTGGISHWNNSEPFQ